ncbi:hypothetical protein DFA_08069 [Cavenderia fasciculata]|uniref:Uncharacterized protein n=1 Tax=Cavenderia fasciculata TaxID=261658 RepID=F4Q4Y1_CACFS|nr:uncharacterized protein DFA_08069 [Cavenderia fasciculata]EGG17087.1 hypothetical protein DFA_08069 [Cavenderia fasciculata]|eukprot:XP_004355571.1 hypothetical protein DFA_08069 [Cavenderia fasciculata]
MKPANLDMEIEQVDFPKLRDPIMVPESVDKLTFEAIPEIDNNNSKYLGHRNNSNCVFKTIRSVVSYNAKNNGFKFHEHDYQTISKIKYLETTDIPTSLELFPNLTKLDIRDCSIPYDALMFLKLAEALKGKSITKLYFPSNCISAYSILSEDIKLSLRCIVTNLSQDVNLNEFPNLVALVVLDCSSTTIGQTLKNYHLKSKRLQPINKQY